MKLELEINNTTKCPVKKAFVESVVRETLRKSGCVFVGKELQLSLAWVSEEEIGRVNRQYRKKDCVTDVLSFCEYVDAKQLEDAPGKEIFLGELLLCYDYIKKSTSKSGDKAVLQKELARIIAHGTLHLLGFSHGRKMFSVQDAVSASAKVTAGQVRHH